MKSDMKQRYRVFRRGWATFYCEDLVTKKQESLKTRDKDEAYRLVAAKNETEEAPAFSLHLARVYWKAGDPAGATRTWQDVMNEIPSLRKVKPNVAGSPPSMIKPSIRSESWLCWKPKPTTSSNICGGTVPGKLLIL